MDGITSGPPAGTLTFTGLDLLVLATVNGSINLMSDVSFQDLYEPDVCARGRLRPHTEFPHFQRRDSRACRGSSIQLTNPGTISVGDFDATAADDLTLQIGGSLLLNGKVRLDVMVSPGTSVANGTNLTLNVTGDYTIIRRLSFLIWSYHEIGAALAAMPVLWLVPRIFPRPMTSMYKSSMKGVAASVQNALIYVGASNDINIVGAATFQMLNSDGHIGGNATINVSAANISTGDALEGTIDNSNGGNIGETPSSILMHLVTVTRQGDANFQILNNDGGHDRR